MTGPVPPGRREENREPCENHGRLPPLCSARSGRGSDPGHWGDPRRREEGSKTGHKSGDLPESEKMCAADNGARLFRYASVCGKTAAHSVSECADFVCPGEETKTRSSRMLTAPRTAQRRRPDTRRSIRNEKNGCFGGAPPARVCRARMRGAERRADPHHRRRDRHLLQLRESSGPEGELRHDHVCRRRGVRGIQRQHPFSCERRGPAGLRAVRRHDRRQKRNGFLSRERAEQKLFRRRGALSRGGPYRDARSGDRIGGRSERQARLGRPGGLGRVSQRR